MIGLFKAMERYDVNHPKQASFNTFAYLYIRGEIQKTISIWRFRESYDVRIMPITDNNAHIVERAGAEWQESWIE